MKNEVIHELYNGFETAYINGNVASNVVYKPQFVSNNYKEGKKVLSYIEEELLLCDHFQIGEKGNLWRDSYNKLFAF